MSLMWRDVAGLKLEGTNSMKPIEYLIVRTNLKLPSWVSAEVKFV
jgi:hypothetical protein